MTRFKRGLGNWIAVLVEQGQANHAWDAANAVVGKSNYKSRVKRFTVSPNPGRAESISDDAVETVDPVRVLAIIIHHVVSVDIMPVPQ